MAKEKMKTRDLAQELKDLYGINKNISSALNNSEKEELLILLEQNTAFLKLTMSFVAKNKELGNNNRSLGRRRSTAETKLEVEREVNQRLSNEVSGLKYKIKELKRQLKDAFVVCRTLLIDDAISKSEILDFFRKLINIVEDEEENK